MLALLGMNIPGLLLIAGIIALVGTIGAFALAVKEK